MTQKPVSRFLVTSDLSRLARWLRLLGFDTGIAATNNIKDWARLCNLQNRFLLTRIKLNNKPNRIMNYLVIQSDAYPEQLKQVIRELDLDEFCIFSRCIYCNRVVYPIEKSKILDRLPEKVKHREEHFTQCLKCRRIYWKGTHFDAMLKTLNHIILGIVIKNISEFVLTEFR